MAEARASRKERAELLDRDCLRARLEWMGDIVIASAVGTTSIVSLILQRRTVSPSAVMSSALVAAFIVAAVFIALSAGSATDSDYLNRYPEALYLRLTGGRTAGPRRHKWITPGVALSLLLSAAVATTAVVTRTNRTNEPAACAVSEPSTLKPNSAAASAAKESCASPG
jgi:hypothetical protein